jgi:hypothetical protein
MNAVTPGLRFVYSSSQTAPLQCCGGVDDLRGIVSRTMVRARELGRDDLTQTRAAAHAVVTVRPDLSYADALLAVGRLRATGAV